MRVIALDPGKLTGWAAADIDTAGEWWHVEHGIKGEKGVVLWLAEEQNINVPPAERYMPPTFDVIVYEDWVLYRAHAEEYIGSDMPYSQQIGQYRLIAWLSDTRIVKQGANRKTFARKQLRAWWPEWADVVAKIEARQHKDGHDGDALLHLFAWTVDNFPTLRRHDA